MTHLKGRVLRPSSWELGRGVGRGHGDDLPVWWRGDLTLGPASRPGSCPSGPAVSPSASCPCWSAPAGILGVGCRGPVRPPLALPSTPALPPGHPSLSTSVLRKKPRCVCPLSPRFWGASWNAPGPAAPRRLPAPLTAPVRPCPCHFVCRRVAMPMPRASSVGPTESFSEGSGSSRPFATLLWAEQ